VPNVLKVSSAYMLLKVKTNYAHLVSIENMDFYGKITEIVSWERMEHVLGVKKSRL
jgi:hypothetical protein